MRRSCAWPGGAHGRAERRKRCHRRRRRRRRRRRTPRRRPRRHRRRSTRPVWPGRRAWSPRRHSRRPPADRRGGRPHDGGAAAGCRWVRWNPRRRRRAARLVPGAG
ncbi:hypothetical protein EEJ42_29810 [Streptomyces botrytidirepellens]|uniref:Uncharacterized protein n=1 Tax=Streptomyces botrytidirepellens TaxID=2486417 RepID=A0A3M8VJC4_9ACTN|nr:hypothetical protein EEJ42_29810 [Streptomyces botrytidirepellens]